MAKLSLPSSLVASGTSLVEFLQNLCDLQPQIVIVQPTERIESKYQEITSSPLIPALKSLTYLQSCCKQCSIDITPTAFPEALGSHFQTLLR